jgi:hypothetical protein
VIVKEQKQRVSEHKAGSKMHNPQANSTKAGKAKASEDEARRGRAYRNPRPHVTRTTEKNPTMLTKVTVAAYEDAEPEDRAWVRARWMKEVQDLEKHSEERKTKAKRTCDDMAGDVASDVEQQVKDEHEDEGSGAGSSGVRYNRRGNPVPEDDPKVLTGDRDGTERAPLLVSPVSLGRTRAAHESLRAEVLHLRKPSCSREF